MLYQLFTVILHTVEVYLTYTLGHITAISLILLLRAGTELVKALTGSKERVQYNLLPVILLI